MYKFEHIPVSAKLVHKDNLDDVLVSNMRSEVPTWVNREALSQLDLSGEEHALLNAHYELGSLRKGQEALIRRSVPLTLPAEIAERDGFGWVKTYFSTCKNGLRLDAKYIPEQLEESLAALTIDKECRITPSTRSQLANITNRMPCNLRSVRLSFSMINDLKNYYFYRKHHEHVPGTMLIEVARQAMYAQFYQTSQAKRGDVTLTIKSLNCDFESYADSNYPITVTVDTCDAPDDAISASDEARTAYFYQRGKRIATICITGVSIKLKLFKRLRQAKPEPNDWFVPVKGFAPSVLFHDVAGQRIEGKLRKVSESGMDIVFPKQPEADAPLDFVICIEGIGYIDGKALPRSLEVGPEGVLGRLDMFEMSLADRRKWCEAIKNYSHLEACVGA